MSQPFSIKQRAKPGKGRSFYGIPAARLAALNSASSDQKISFDSQIQDLYQFTVLFVDSARDLAKAGKNDQARSWWRFFENSRVLDVLENHFGAAEMIELRQDLSDLKKECHPENVPDFSTDLQAIRFCLSEILSYVQTEKSSSSAVSCRSDFGCSGRSQFESTNFERGSFASSQSAFASPGYSSFPARPLISPDVQSGASVELFQPVNKE
jgi:hypothetical protein